MFTEGDIFAAFARFNLGGLLYCKHNIIRLYIGSEAKNRCDKDLMW